MEDFGIKIGLSLDRSKSAKQINEEIDSLSKNAKKVKITAGLLKTESKKQIKSDLKSVTSGLTEKAIKVKIGVDKEDIKRQIVSAIQSVAQQKYSIEIKPTIVEPTTTKGAAQTGSTTTTKTQRTVKEVKPTAVNKDLSGVLDNISKQQSTLNKLGQTDEVKKLINDAENLKVKVKELYNSTDEVKSKSGELVQEYKNNSAELSHRVSIEKTEYQQTLNQINLEKRKQNLYNQMQNSLKSNTNMTKEQANEIKKLMAGLSINNIDETAKKFKYIQSEISAADKTGKSFIDTITSGAKKFINWYGVSQTIMKGVEALRKMVDAVKDVDAAMTELKKVTDETDAAYASYLTKAEAQARSVGASVSDTVNSTADFARLGYSLDEASDLSKTALIYKNVGDGISDVSEASESIISTMKAFNIEATNSMSIVDKFNEVGNNFAISSEGIGEAMQRSAAALATSGNSIDESIGLITGMNAVVQNPEVVGTALKTMTMYLRAAKAEAQSAGEETEGMANSVSQLRQDILTLTKNKVDIIPDGKNFKSTYEIVKEIAAIWKDMSEVDQAALLKLIAGKRGANSVASLITNFSDAEKAMNTAANSSGSALKENETYLDSVNGKTAQLKATFESFSNDVLSSNLLTFIIGLGDDTLSLADSLAKVNALLPITAALVSAMSIGVEKHKSKNKADDIFEGLVANYAEAQVLRDKIAADDLKDVPELDDTTRSNLTAKAVEKEAVAKNNALNALSNSNSTTKREFNSKMELSSASGKLSKNLAEEEKAILGANAARESSIKTEFAEMSTLNKISLAITALLVIKAVIDTIAASEQKAIQRGEEAVNNYTQSQETLKNNAATIKEVSSKYQELSKGVNNLGENVSLTTDEYAEYNQISNQIADMFPSLIQGYTDEGNAILTCKNNIEKLTEAYNESRKAANEEILSNSKDIAKDFADKMQRLIKGHGTGISGFKEWMSDEFHGTPKPTKGAIDTGNKLLNMGSEDRKKYIQENMSYLVGPTIDDNIFAQLGIKMPYNMMNAQELAEYFEKNISTVKATISTYERDAESATEGAKEIANALLGNYQLEGKGELSNLPSSYQQLVQSSINNMSFDDASNFNEKTFESDVQKYVDDTISTVKKLYSNPEFEELSNKMSTIVDADVISKSTADEFKKGVNGFINRLKANNYSDGFVQSVQDYFQSSLDKVDNNAFTYDMDKVYKVASKNTENKSVEKKSSWDEWVDSLTEKQSKIVYSLYLDADDAEITLDDIKSKAEAIFDDPVQADIYARKIVDDFTLIANGINSADNARKNFQNGLEAAKENEYNTDFNSYADAVNTAKEQFFGENATPGSKQAKAAVDYLFGEGYYSKHSDDLNGIKDKIKNAQKIYGNYTDSKGKEQSSNGTGFIEQLEKIDLKAKGLQTTVEKLSNGKYKFDIKPEEMGQIAKLLGITEDGAWSCVNALQMLGNVVMYDSESFDRLITRLKKSDEWSNVVQDYGDKQVLNYDVLSKYCDTAKIDIDNMSDSIKKFKKNGNTVVKFTGSVKEAIKMLKSYNLATEDKNKKGNYTIDLDKTVSQLQEMGYTSEQISSQMEEIKKASNSGAYKIEFTSSGKKLDKKNVTGKLNELLSEQTDLTDDATNSSNQLNESMEKASDTTYSKQISSVQLLSNAFKNVNAVVGNLTAKLQSLNGSTFSTSITQSVTDKDGKTSTTKTGLKVSTSYSGGGVNTRTFHPPKGIGGRISAKGNPNVKKSTNSLVGEVAPEIIAHRDTGEWELVEQPQFKALRKGDIVFDGEQTKDILNNGYTTSFGESYAVRGTVGKPHGSKTSKKKSKKSSSSKSSTKHGDQLDKALDKFQKWFSKLFDWIEVKLERQTDKISNYIDSAERASDEGRYKSSASAYRKALGATYTQVDYEQRAYSKYKSQANATMNKGVKNGILSKSRAKSIKKLVANGTIDIKKYNDATQEVIKSYQEWYDKAKDAKDSLSELHDNIRTYIDDLKSLREAERDAKIDKNSDAESIGTGGVEFTQATQMANLRFKNSQINSNNSAYSSEIKSGESDAKSIGGKGKSAISKELRTKSGKKKGKYKTALKNAQKAIKSKKKVSSSDLNTIRNHKTSKSRKIYESLYAYNLQLDTIEDMKYEAAVEYASNSADYYENLKSQYDVMTDKSNDKISLNEQKSDNAKSAKSKNSYLQSNAKEYDTIVANDTKEIKDYNNRIKSNSKNINTSTKKARGTNYKNASKKQRNTINKFIAKVRGYVKKQKTIPAGDISKLASYYSKGYVSGKFYHSCINYNNALQSKKEAEAQRDIDRETAISEKASIGTSKFENVQNEQENYVHAAQHELTTHENTNDLKTTKGGVLSNTDYERVKSANEKLKNTYTNERKALQKQIDENLKNGLWTKSSQEYIEAVEQEKDLDETIAQCTIKQQELNNDIANIPFDNIEKAVSLFDSMNSYLDSIVKLAQALGEELSSDEFTKQIDNNNKKIAENQKGANEAKSNWEKAKKDADNAYGGKSASEWETEYYNYLATINGLKADNQELRNSLIDDVYLASFTKLQEELDKIGDIKSGIKNLIDDSTLFDKNGIITKYGTAQLSLLVDEMNNAQKSVSNYSSEIDKLNNLLSSGEITQYEYNERISEVQKNMLSSASDVKSYIDNIISLYKEQAQAEMDAIKKLIDARKKALDAKRSYYEYDKTISDKNKDIQSLKAQIAALEGIETAEAKAKKAQLNAQLTEQQDDLNDTINSHMLELSSNALDELSESLQDSFDDYWDKLWLNLDNVKELIEAANKTTADAAKTTADALNSLLSFYGIPTTQVSGYASGSKYIDRNKLALTQENGSEIIVRRSDGTILTPLKRGDGVIPHDLTQNLYKWGQNSPANFMGALTENATNIPMAIAPQYNIEQSFDSLIRVDGNVDSTVVGDLEKFAQSFYKGAYDYTIKSITSDARKLGIKV